MSTEPTRRTNHSARLERRREWWAQEQENATDPADIVEAAPLTESQAKTLDKRIRLIVGNISDELDKLAGLIAQAKAGQIHVALGIKSWTAYLADVAQIGWQDRADRRKIVALLSGEGMSQRAIASAVGVSKKTVQNDQAQVDTNYPPDNVIGLDGKTYQHKPTPTEAIIERLVELDKSIDASDQRVVESSAAAARLREERDAKTSQRKPTPEPKPEGIGRSNQKHQVHALETVPRELSGIAEVLEGLFENGFQKTCTPDFRAQQVQEIRQAWTRINKVLTVIIRPDDGGGAK
jgi:transposase